MATSPQPLSHLRGAGVQVDARRVARVVLAIVVVTLLVLSVVFFAGALRKNNQISALRARGVTVTAQITGCRGLLGGSGSNQAGYSCKGTYKFHAQDPKSYTVTIPGNELRRQGSTVAVVTLRDDPQLVETADRLATEHASFGAFVPSIVLFLGVLALGGLAARSWRRAR